MGGTQIAVQSLAHELTQRGHQVTVVTLTPFDASPQKADAVRVTRLSFPRVWGLTHLTESVVCFREIVEDHMREPFDCLHLFHVFPFGLAAVFLKKVLHLPLITTLMGLEIYSLYGKTYGPGLHARFSGPFRSLPMDLSDIITAPSMALTAYARAQGCKKHIELIPHGVDPDEYNSSSLRVKARNLRRKLEIETDEQMILTVHRLHRHKDLTTAISALRRVLQDRPNTRLVVVGGGPEYERFLAAARKERVTSKMICVGCVNHSELPVYYAAADLFLLSTFFETFGLVLLEAMAAGRCVVASDAGAVREIVQDGLTGFLFPVGNVAALTNILLKALADEKLRFEMGLRGRKHVSNHYSWARIAERYDDLYLALSRSRGLE